MRAERWRCQASSDRRDYAMTFRWRVAILDSGSGEAAREAVRFVADGRQVRTEPLLGDRLGHGTRVSAIIASATTQPELFIGQVLDQRGLSTPALIAAAIHWALDLDADLIHLSLGLPTDRDILRNAVAAATAAARIVVAAAPARGRPVYPAGYPGVLQGTGDSRCTGDELSYLGPRRFGGTSRCGTSGGSSIGAANLTRVIIGLCPPRSSIDLVERRLAGAARYHGPESRGR